MDLAICNVAIARQPLDHPAMAEFASQLEAVNAIARATPGFVWTPADGEAGDAALVFGHPLALPNISTWRSFDALRDFVYRGPHGAALRRRHEWFEELPPPFYVLWWVPEDARPPWTEARARLSHLATHGPTPTAFTFTHRFEATDPAGT